MILYHLVAADVRCRPMCDQWSIFVRHLHHDRRVTFFIPVHSPRHAKLGRDANGAALDLERAYLRSQILTSADEEFQDYAKKRLLELSGAAEADRLEQLREDFVRRHAQNFPYVPPPTYVMVESE